MQQKPSTRKRAKGGKRYEHKTDLKFEPAYLQERLTGPIYGVIAVHNLQFGVVHISRYHGEGGGFQNITLVLFSSIQYRKLLQMGEGPRIGHILIT